MHVRVKFPLGKNTFCNVGANLCKEAEPGGYSKGNNLFLGLTMGVPDKFTMEKTGHICSLHT